MYGPDCENNTVNYLGTIAIHLEGIKSYDIGNNTFSNGTTIPVTNH